MEDLLRMITSNPILLFLIIGAILSYLQKGKEQEKGEAEKRGGPTGQGKQQEVDWREIFRQEADVEPKQTKSKQQTYTYTEDRSQATLNDGINRSNELLEKYEKAKQNKRAVDKKIGESLKNSPIYKDDITAQIQVKLDFSNISKEEAIKGVVWSEILGKPRSKGTYRAGIMNQRRKQG